MQYVRISISRIMMRFLYIVTVTEIFRNIILTCKREKSDIKHKTALLFRTQLDYSETRYIE